MMTFARPHARDVAPFAREEQAGRMVRAAADLLAVELPDARDRARYREISRRLGHALHSPAGGPRTILAASPLVRDEAGVARPLVSLLRGLEDDPDSGVRSAMTIFLTSDWSPAN